MAKFEKGRPKTGGKVRGSRNKVPSKKRVQQRLLAQVHASLERHAAVIEEMYRTDPLEAGKLDARVNRDAIELLGMSERLSGDGGQRSSTSEKQIEASAAKAGAAGDAIEASRLYLKMIEAAPGSDEARIVAARIALSQRSAIETQLEAIAAAAGVAVAQVQAVLDAAGAALETLPAKPEPAPQPIGGYPPRLVPLQESAPALPTKPPMPTPAPYSLPVDVYGRRLPSGCVPVSRFDDDVPIFLASAPRSRPQ